MSSIEEIQAKIPSVAPATRIGGGLRVAQHGPSHLHQKSDADKQKEEKQLKAQADHDALALSRQIDELDAMHSGSVKEELQKHTAKVVASTFHPPPFAEKPAQRNHAHQNHQLGQPGGAHACNNYLH